MAALLPAGVTAVAAADLPAAVAAVGRGPLLIAGTDLPAARSGARRRGARRPGRRLRPDLRLDARGRLVPRRPARAAARPARPRRAAGGRDRRRPRAGPRARCVRRPAPPRAGAHDAGRRRRAGRRSARRRRVARRARRRLTRIGRPLRLGGPDSNRELSPPKGPVLPLHHPPGSARYYDAPRARPDRGHPRRRRGDADALSLPKVLHPICGRPMILWPLLARPRGRRRARRRRRQPQAPARGAPARRRRASRSRRSRAAPATPSPPPPARSTPAAPVLVVNGDMPLITGEAIAALVAAHEEAGAAATIATMELDDPTGYGRVVRDARRRRRARRRDQGRRATRPSEELAIREVNAGLYAFDGGALLAALARGRHRQRPGRALPARRAAAAARGRPARRGVPARRPDLALGVNDRVDLAEVTAARAAPHPRAPPARRRDDRRPGDTLIEAAWRSGATP